MGRKSQVLIFITLLLLFSTLTSSTSGRKLLAGERRRRSYPPAAPDNSSSSLYLAALPKGSVPKSGPSKRGHADNVDEKLIARHLSAVARILRYSVPSPGMGH